MDGEFPEAVAKVAEAATDFAVEHLVLTMTVRVDIQDRRFTIEVDNGSDIWADMELKTEIREFFL